MFLYEVYWLQNFTQSNQMGTNTNFIATITSQGKLDKTVKKK